MRRAAVLLFLAWAAFLFVAALGLFTSGFLLTRVELPDRSRCGEPPGAPPPLAAASGCWLPGRFRRAVLVLIDALRFDFARYEEQPRPPHARRPFQNRLPLLHDLGRRQPRHARLFRFRADPPTTTMQRIKALTTGTLPTFVDAGSNFGATAIREDNLVLQLRGNGKRVVFMGDDTWDGLFPRAFARAHFYSSFNVKDLHTVDRGIQQHLYRTVDGGDWELLIAHFLGVDHCGHKHGPDHPEMAKKLSEMNEMLRLLIAHLDNETLLLVAGDHGMTQTGDHGGESEEEVDAALFVYSKAPLFQSQPPEEPETVAQVNLTPTLALLLGVPVPYNSIGEVMAELFAVGKDEASAMLAQLAAYSLNAKQVNRFLHSYSLTAQDLPAQKLQHLEGLFLEAMMQYEQLLAQAGVPGLRQLQSLQSRFRHYLRETRAVCAESWARFHMVRMLAGCALLSSSCVLCYMAAKVASGLNFSYRHLLFYPVLWGVAGAALLGLAHLFSWATADLILLSSWGAAASQLGFFWHWWTRHSSWGASATSARPLFRRHSLGRRLWPGLDAALPSLILLLRCCAMLSDSFVMAEAQVAPFLLASLVVLGVLRLHWKGKPEDSPPSLQVLGLLVTILVCVRLSGLFHQCREETPRCSSSPLLAPLSSLHDPQAKSFHYLLCMAVLVGLVCGVRCWLRHYGNLNNPVALVLFVRWGLPLLAACIGCYWAITSGAEEALVERHMWMQLTLVGLPLGIFALVTAGLLLVLCNPVTVFVRNSQEPLVTGVSVLSPSSQPELLQVIPQLYHRMQLSLKSQLKEAKAGNGATVAAYGLGSVYSAALLVSLALLGLFLISLHSERLSLAFLLLFLEGFALLWLHAWTVAPSPGQDDPFTVPWEAVIAWAFAAAQFFYATGHQPVFPAIHWKAAFVGFEQGHESKFLPALLVVANTFASHILFAVGCPLLLLWPFVCRMPSSANRKPKSEALKVQEEMMEMKLREAPERFSAALLQLGLQYLLVLGVQMLACVSAAMILRRHLMVWKVFAPKFVFEAVGFMVSSVFLLLGIGLVMRVDCAISLWFKNIILAQSG